MDAKATFLGLTATVHSTLKELHKYRLYFGCCDMDNRVGKCCHDPVCFSCDFYYIREKLAMFLASKCGMIAFPEVSNITNSSRLGEDSQELTVMFANDGQLSADYIRREVQNAVKEMFPRYCDNMILAQSQAVGGKGDLVKALQYNLGVHLHLHGFIRLKGQWFAHGDISNLTQGLLAFKVAFDLTGAVSNDSHRAQVRLVDFTYVRATSFSYTSANDDRTIVGTSAYTIDQQQGVIKAVYPSKGGPPSIASSVLVSQPTNISEMMFNKYGIKVSSPWCALIEVNNETFAYPLDCLFRCPLLFLNSKTVQLEDKKKCLDGVVKTVQNILLKTSTSVFSETKERPNALPSSSQLYSAVKAAINVCSSITATSGAEESSTTGITITASQKNATESHVSNDFLDNSLLMAKGCGSYAAFDITLASVRKNATSTAHAGSGSIYMRWASGIAKTGETGQESTINGRISEGTAKGEVRKVKLNIPRIVRKAELIRDDAVPTALPDTTWNSVDASNTLCNVLSASKRKGNDSDGENEALAKPSYKVQLPGRSFRSVPLQSVLNSNTKNEIQGANSRLKKVPEAATQHDEDVLDMKKNNAKCFEVNTMRAAAGNGTEQKQSKKEIKKRFKPENGKQKPKAELQTLPKKVVTLQREGTTTVFTHALPPSKAGGLAADGGRDLAPGVDTSGKFLAEKKIIDAAMKASIAAKKEKALKKLAGKKEKELPTTEVEKDTTQQLVPDRDDDHTIIQVSVPFASSALQQSPDHAQQLELGKLPVPHSTPPAPPALSLSSSTSSSSETYSSSSSFASSSFSTAFSTSPPPSVKTSEDTAAQDTSAHWTCEVCTLVNALSARHCGICRSSRPRELANSKKRKNDDSGCAGGKKMQKCV